MAKFSTIQELTGADMEQGGSLMRRYLNQSSLPTREKRLSMPKLCVFRRDRVLRRLMKNEMTALASRIAAWSNSDA